MSVSDLNLLISQLLPEPHAGLLSGILFGTKASLSTDLYNALVNTGTLHIVALSGTNITILSQLINQSILPIASRRVASLLTIILIIGFIWFVGPSPSVVRAGIMGCVSLLGLLFGKQIWALWTFMITVFIMLSVSPQLVSDLSFQLSAGATLGMILFGKKEEIKPTRATKSTAVIDEATAIKAANANEAIKAKPILVFPFLASKLQSSFFSHLARFISDDLRTTLSAQILTIPIILFYFHRISLISPLPNLLIGWVLAPLTAMGMVTVAADLIWRPLGQVCAWITWVPLEFVIRVIEVTGSLPFASIGW
jgi:competence protein ComEC